MQFGFILLVLAVALQLTSINADATLLPHADPVGVASVDGKGTRFLRTIVGEDEERADTTTAVGKISGFFDRLFGKKLQAPSNVEIAAKSLRAEAAALEKLTKAVPDSAAEYDLYFSTLKEAKKSFTLNVNKHFDKDLKATHLGVQARSRNCAENDEE